MALEIVDVVVILNLEDTPTANELRELGEAEAKRLNVHLEQNAPYTSRDEFIIDGELVNLLDTNKIAYVFVGSMDVR